MEMEVMIPSPPPASDFFFDSSTSTPYISATSSPNRPGSFFYSAPTSPSRVSAFHHGSASLSAIPFNWEERPGIPKSHVSTATSSTYGDAEEVLEDADFAFDFSGQLDTNSLPADELFERGRIKPLKPPPRFHYEQFKPHESSSSPRSPKRMITKAFSPRKKPEFDPFAEALEQTRNKTIEDNDNRGRDRNHNPNPRKNKNSRSLSPFRVSDLLFDPETETNQENPKNSSSFSSLWYKKWKIKDLLLFRSASESRAEDKKQQLKKYSQLKKTRQDDVRNSSFRSTDSSGSVSSRRRSTAPISAHEMHYTINRAFSEEMRKRTSLPYKQGFLGCLGFHPTVTEISKGINSTGSLSRG